MAQSFESSSMGGVITNYETVNFSTAKQKYSFSKSPRFIVIEKKITDKIGYDLPTTLGNRAAGFGIGHRFQTPLETDRNKSPPPNTYNLKSDFDIGKPGTANGTKRGMHSFGIGREYFQKVYIPNNTQQPDPAIPGPGTYTTKLMTVGSDGRRWNFQSRSKNIYEPVNMSIKNDIPGPGHYTQAATEINKYGVYKISNIANSQAATWSPSKKRFQSQNKERMQRPGPGEYNPSDYSGGVYLLSNFKNTGTHKYVVNQTISKRTKQDTPGPGHYEAPSDFGHLELFKYIDQSYRSPRGQTQQGPRSSQRSISRNATQSVITQKFSRNSNRTAMNYTSRDQTKLFGSEMTSNKSIRSRVQKRPYMNTIILPGMPQINQTGEFRSTTRESTGQNTRLDSISQFDPEANTTVKRGKSREGGIERQLRRERLQKIEYNSIIYKNQNKKNLSIQRNNMKFAGDGSSLIQQKDVEVGINEANNDNQYQ